MTKLIGLNFEIFGKVQGVFFRKYTQKRAEELSIKGWCMNTREGTVTGELEGEKSKIEQMKNWLQTTGSPQSRIDNVEFKNEREIAQLSYQKFSIKK